MNSFTRLTNICQSATAPPASRISGESPVANDLYRRVLDAILEQRIHPASRLTEESLGKMFGARRADIRRILMQLSHQRIIILRTNHRPRIAMPDAEQTRQTLHARRLTETTLVRLICQQARLEGLKGLRVLVEQQRQAVEQNRRGTAIRLSGEFHLHLAHMAGNAPLAHFLGSLVPMTSLAIARRGLPMHSYCAWQSHVEIVHAVEHREIAKAMALMSGYLDHLEQALLNCESSISRVAGQVVSSGEPSHATQSP